MLEIVTASGVVGAFVTCTSARAALERAVSRVHDGTTRNPHRAVARAVDFGMMRCEPRDAARMRRSFTPPGSLMPSLVARVPADTCLRVLAPHACLLGVSAALSLGAASAAAASNFRFEPTAADPTILGEIASSAADSTEAGAAQDAAPTTEPAAHAFGAADTWHFDLGGAYAISIGSDDNDAGTSGDLGIANLGAHWFVADGLSFGAFVEAIYASQDPDDAFGGGAGLLARWYFLREERFTLFFEGGCGFVVFDNETPPGGTNFNLTPRLGGGATLRLSDTAQLVARVGWFHISNAQTGDENPGYDSIAIGAGVSFAF
jgi:hypothetical protein